jgi:hypothetical protein
MVENMAEVAKVRKAKDMTLERAIDPPARDEWREQRSEGLRIRFEREAGNE